MADSSEPAFLFLYRKEAVAPVDYLSTFATAPFLYYLVLMQSFYYTCFCDLSIYDCRNNNR